jgi:hypothetical protein
MAAKKGKGKSISRNRRTPALNVVNLAQTYLQTAIVTQAAFRTTPYEFFTGQQTQTRFKYVQNSYAAGGGVSRIDYDVTGYMPIGNGTQLTLPELFGRDAKDANGTTISVSAGGGPLGFWDSMKTNVELNGGWVKPVMQTVVLNVGFTVGKRVFKNQLGIVRKGLKMAKLDRMVKV